MQTAHKVIITIIIDLKKKKFVYCKFEMHTYTHLHAEQGGTRENEQLQLNFTNTASSQHGAQEIVTSIHKNNSNNGKSCQQKGIYRIYIHYVHWLAGRQARTHTLL